jgi:hypothetical protein
MNIFKILGIVFLIWMVLICITDDRVVPASQAFASTQKLTWKYTQFNMGFTESSPNAALAFLNRLPEERALEAKVSSNHSSVCIFYRE